MLETSEIIVKKQEIFEFIYDHYLNRKKSKAKSLKKREHVALIMANRVVNLLAEKEMLGPFSEEIDDLILSSEIKISLDNMDYEVARYKIGNIDNLGKVMWPLLQDLLRSKKNGNI